MTRLYDADSTVHNIYLGDYYRGPPSIDVLTSDANTVIVHSNCIQGFLQRANILITKIQNIEYWPYCDVIY